MQTSGLPNFPLFDTIFCITPTKQDYMYRLYTYLATLVLARISATFRCLLCQRLLLRATETNCLELLANGNGRSRNGARASLPTGLQNIYIHKRVISSLLFCQYLPYSFDKTLADKKKTKWRPSQHKTHGIKVAQMREQYLHWQFAPICHICHHVMQFDMMTSSSKCWGNCKVTDTTWNALCCYYAHFNMCSCQSWCKVETCLSYKMCDFLRKYPNPPSVRSIGRHTYSAAAYIHDLISTRTPICTIRVNKITKVNSFFQINISLRQRSRKCLLRDESQLLKQI